MSEHDNSLPSEYPLFEELCGQIEQIGVESFEDIVFRPVSKADLEYLKDRYPFMQLISGREDRTIAEQPTFIQAKSGWIIYDYGDALCASPGVFIYAGGDYRIAVKKGRKEDEGGEGGGALINGGHGTIVKQAVDTGAEMMWIAMEREWPGASVVEGHRWMKWGAWMLAEDREFPLGGYIPTEEDQKRRRHLRRKPEEFDLLRMQLRSQR
ncbi:MAG TPA: hypothetical protein VJB02_01105 [Coxiellaceae bacterium]|nr:hypothetical protein [Coxiellaceae bacterium]